MLTIDNILIKEENSFIVSLSFEKNNIKFYSPLLKKAYEEVEAYLLGNLKTFSLPLDLKISDFTFKVLMEMMHIPYGETITYKELGNRINTKAYKAVGSACGRNPIPIIIPCHRVVASNGIGGFSYGIEIKKELLKIEKTYLFK